MNLIKSFGENVTYDSIKSQKNIEFHPLFRKHIFGKTIGRGSN